MSADEIEGLEKISEAEYLETIGQMYQEGDQQLMFESTPTAVDEDNIYNVMARKEQEMSERDFFNFQDREARTILDVDMMLGSYGVGDLVYDVVIEPGMFLTGSTFDIANGLLLGLDRMVVETDNYFRSKKGEPKRVKGDSIFGDIARMTNSYHMGQLNREINRQAEAIRAMPDSEDRFENAKRITGEYASFYAYLFGALEVGKKIPGVRTFAKKVDTLTRQAILKNPWATAGVEGLGVLAETEVVARGGGALEQGGAGITATVVVPFVYNAHIKSQARKRASAVARAYFENMGYRNFQSAAELLQRVTDPEKSAEYLHKLMKDGNLPPDVKAPLQLLLGDEGFTYLETILNTAKDGAVNISLRDKEFLQQLNKLIEPVSKGKVVDAESWFRLSQQMFEKDLAASTSKLTQEAIEQLSQVTKNLPDPDEIATATFQALQESKTIFSKQVDDAWELVDLDVSLPGTGIFGDFNRIVSVPTIDINAKNINEVLNRFESGKGGLKQLNEEYLLRLNADEVYATQDILRQGVIEATGGSKKALKKFDSFIAQVDAHRQQRQANGVHTGNAFSNPEALRNAYGDTYLTNVATVAKIPYESATMQTIEALAQKHGIDALPLSAQEILRGDRKIKTIGDLYELRRTLGTEGMGGIEKGQVRQNAYFANEIRSSILDDLAELPDEGNLTLKRAIAFSRDYNTTFKSGIVGKILQLSSDGSPIDPTLSLLNVFKTGGNNLNRTGKVNVNQILLATKNIKSTPAGDITRVKNGSVEQLLQDYMVNLFVNTRGVVQDGALVPGRGQLFYENYKAILDMPEMIRAKETILNASGDVSVIKKMLDNNVSLAKVKAGFYGKESLGAVNLFLGDDITTGIQKMMMSKGGIEQLKELQRLVMSKEVPEHFFTDLGISRSLVNEGIKDSVRLGLIGIAEQGTSATSFSLLNDLVKTGYKSVGVNYEGQLIPFLKQAGFTAAEIKNVQKFANELEKYGKYIATKGGKANEPGGWKNVDNFFHSIIGLFVGGVGADFFSSGSSLAAATYIKKQTTNTLQKLSGNQAITIINDAMSDPKLLDELLRTPTYFNKNQLAKSRPYLFKYLVSRGLENFGAPSDEEVAQKLEDLQKSDIRLPEELLFGLELDNAANSSISSTLISDTPRLEAIDITQRQLEQDAGLREIIDRLGAANPENLNDPRNRAIIEDLERREQFRASQQQ
jgi:hypothetical protein|tara:strand:+ start:2370 stop:5972 length:3603 start_codon:yes stop_codon:yes gene_type:complete